MAKPVKVEASRSRHRRDADATRAAILASATRLFACRGYERSGVREIAAEAGVTAALVNRYFGSKEGLFEAVVATAFDIRPLIADDGEGLAEHLARIAVHGHHEELGDPLIPLMLILQSITEPHAVRLLHDNLDRTKMRYLVETLDGPDAETRAALVLSQLVGFAIFDRLLQTKAFRGADRERLAAALQQTLSVCIDAPGLPEPPSRRGS